jgi:hypothetical protein
VWFCDINRLYILPTQHLCVVIITVNGKYVAEPYQMVGVRMEADSYLADSYATGSPTG